MAAGKWGVFPLRHQIIPPDAAPGLSSALAVPCRHPLNLGGMGKSARGYLGRFRLLNVVHTGQEYQISAGYGRWPPAEGGRQNPAGEFVKDAELIGCLRREFQIGKALPDPRVIEVFDFGIDRGVPYLATEWFTGPNLKKWIRSKEEREKIAHLVPKIIEDAAACRWPASTAWDGFIATSSRTISCCTRTGGSS